MATSESRLEGLKADLLLIDAPTVDDCSAVTSILMEYVKRGMNSGNPVSKITDISRCGKYVSLLKEKGGLNVYKDKSGNVVGAIAFSKCDLWFSNASCLCEEFVISLPSTSGIGRIAVDRLRCLADIHGCSIIASGNLLSPYDQKVENLYMRKGEYDLKVGQFIKVL